MSVEKAREELLAAGWAWHGDEDIVEPKIDRLILEVQAEMPCYETCRCPADGPCGCDRPYRYECGHCPSCTARMKLKETADAR